MADSSPNGSPVNNLKVEVRAGSKKEHSPRYRKETHGRGDDIDVNTPISDFRGGSLAIVADMHSRTHRFEVKLMDLEPHDPYAKTAKRVAVLADEQRKTAKKEKLDNKRQRISKRHRKSTTQQMKGARSAYQKEATKKLRNSEVVLRGPHMPTPPPVATTAAHHVTYNIFVDNCRNGERTKLRLNHYPLEFKGWECVCLTIIAKLAMVHN
uniref:60S ribosomal protein L4 n=1 Tax=Tanacetum cinerariifolium TaxID=118510 RepID=A0A6L2LH23_TANCI|nr:60S ribosomal protein L4 [Tanacetum cinerariifolium]